MTPEQRAQLLRLATDNVSRFDRRRRRLRRTQGTRSSRNRGDTNDQRQRDRNSRTPVEPAIPLLKADDTVLVQIDLPEDKPKPQTTLVPVQPGAIGTQMTVPYAVDSVPRSGRSPRSSTPR